jgi:hypothetical protein
MKKNILKLRILGMATFLIYLLLVMFSPSKVSYTLIQIQFYIKTYAEEEE